ncbi:MAG: rhomboid family intramembrane serine protease [Spirochaetaceae bacterium]|nr:rhomboid family intramembrane serine protease [Spirochaetaceae bacterium]
MRLRYNAPITLTFSLFAAAVFLSDAYLSPGLINNLFILEGRGLFNFSYLPGYVRLFSYIFGHESLPHLISNLTYILLLGPLIEERYGSSSLALMIFVTAIANGLINVLFFPSGLMGASGIVFMMIVLSSFANVRRGDFPLTFLFIAAIFLWQEIATLFTTNNISQISHLMGGICGAIFGFAEPAFKGRDGNQNQP